VFGDAGAHNCRPLLAPDLVRLAFQERDQPTVAAVLAEVERADREGDLPLSAALVPWCRGLAARDSAALADAEEALIELDRPLDVEAVRSDRAVCLAAGGRTGEARRLRDEFLGSVDDLGMAGMRRHLLRRLEPFGLGRPRAERAARPVSGWESLTPSEQAIVDLVAQGLSNREIGEERGCSARTVETHLGRTYRKLGVTNRTQLAVEVAERAAGSG
jgi:DNA-binding CsgD family transcriptional regulator